jgi:hypothetical protein
MKKNRKSRSAGNKQEYLTERGFEQTPEFYKSISNNPSVNRLRSLDSRLQVPYIIEYLSGQLIDTSMEIPFKRTYRNIPLVVGIYDTEELGEAKARPLLPNNQNMTVTRSGVTIGNSSFPAKIGGRFRLRVYNLPIIGDPTIIEEVIDDDVDWKPINTAPTRQSADDPTYVLRFTEDVSDRLSVGMKVQFIQSSARVFGFITAIGSWDGSNIDVTMYGGTDYNVGDTSVNAISGFEYSGLRVPFGFPMDPNKWSELYSVASALNESNPTQNAWYNIGGRSLTIPIGAWVTTWVDSLGAERGATTGFFDEEVTLSTANNSQSDAEFTANMGHIPAATSSFLGIQSSKTKVLNLSSKTTYYLNQRTTAANVANIYSGNGNFNTIIKATCAYL